MNAEEQNLEKHISISELEDEELSVELSKAQKRAAIRQAKREYGPDWKQQLKDGIRKGIRVNREGLILHSTNPNLRSYNDPRSMRRRGE